MKILALALLLSSTSSFASVVKNYDHKNACDLYRVLRGEEKANYQPQKGDEVITPKDTYGFGVMDLSIDFNNRSASSKIMINIALGFNRFLTGSTSKIDSDNKDFTDYINQVNRKATLLQSVCINRDRTIIYFTKS